MALSLLYSFLLVSTIYIYIVDLFNLNSVGYSRINCTKCTYTYGPYPHLLSFASSFSLSTEKQEIQKFSDRVGMEENQKKKKQRKRKSKKKKLTNRIDNSTFLPPLLHCPQPLSRAIQDFSLPFPHSLSLPFSLQSYSYINRHNTNRK